jgi:hypothetical protein
LEATGKLNSMSKGQVCTARTPTTRLEMYENSFVKLLKKQVLLSSNQLAVTSEIVRKKATRRGQV